MRAFDQSKVSAKDVSVIEEADAPAGDPEAEYFRLSCLALKIIYDERDSEF